MPIILQVRHELSDKDIVVALIHAATSGYSLHKATSKAKVVAVLREYIGDNGLPLESIDQAADECGEGGYEEAVKAARLLGITSATLLVHS